MFGAPRSGDGESTYLDEHFVIIAGLFCDESWSSAALVTEERRHRLFGSIGILLGTLFIALVSLFDRFWLLRGGYIELRNESGQMSWAEGESNAGIDSRCNWVVKQVAGDVCADVSV